MKILLAVLMVVLQTAAAARSADKPASRPMVNNEKIGITVTVNDDDRTLEATGADGKLVWKADVIKAGGQPRQGAAVIRALLIDGDKVTAVYGKNTHVTYDMNSGKLLGIAAD